MRSSKSTTLAPRRTRSKPELRETVKKPLLSSTGSVASHPRRISMRSNYGTLATLGQDSRFSLTSSAAFGLTRNAPAMPKLARSAYETQRSDRSDARKAYTSESNPFSGSDGADRHPCSWESFRSLRQLRRSFRDFPTAADNYSCNDVDP